MITDEQIEKLRSEAAEAGDLVQVALCNCALRGSVTAKKECERVINDASASEKT